MLNAQVAASASTTITAFCLILSDLPSQNIHCTVGHLLRLQNSMADDKLLS